MFCVQTIFMSPINFYESNESFMRPIDFYESNETFLHIKINKINKIQMMKNHGSRYQKKFR